MLTDLTDEWPGVPPLPALLAIPTPDTPYRLYRRWAPTGAAYLEDGSGRRWWAFTATVPRECPWCEAVITSGYEAWGVGSVCGWHCRIEWKEDRDGRLDNPGDSGVHSLDAIPLVQPGTDRLNRAPTPTCPVCKGRVVVLADGHWYCPTCRQTIDPVSHTPILPQGTED